MADRGRRELYDIPDEGKKSINQDKIKEEVEALAKKGPLTPSTISELYKKYGDEEAIVDEILYLLSKRLKKIRKQAKEIAEKIYKKYISGDRPLHEILERMMSYKIKNKWSDAEYDEFRKELTYLLTGNRALEVDNNQNLTQFRSRINRALGNTKILVEDGLHIKDSEHGVLAEILSMHEKWSSLHKTVFMHSLVYEDCSLVAMTGEYKRERHIASNYIHPLLACMFLPKFDIFEIHMLYSDFGGIVKSRYEKKPIVSEPDALLFYDITSDPGDVVCEINSPMADLRNRYKVQISLWETVLKLRSGFYYEGGSTSEFMTTLNVCRNNLYENADQIYTQDEGAMMKKLLNVFSLRPTIIVTKPISSIASFIASPFGFGMNMNPAAQGNVMTPGFKQGSYPFNNQPVLTITSIAMINLQIPPLTMKSESIHIANALNQTIWITENKQLIPKEQSIIYSKEVLIFYVNRRVQRIQIRTFSSPLSFSQLPLTMMSNFERLNSYPVQVPERLTLSHSGETYLLRSVVAISETSIRQGEKSTDIITGCTGLIMQHRDFAENIFDPIYYLYDPFGASLPVRHPNPDRLPELQGYITNKPISRLEPVFTPPPETTGGVLNPSFSDRASSTGTIYIYQKSGGYTMNEVISL